MSVRRAKWLPLKPWILFEPVSSSLFLIVASGMFLGEVTIVFGLSVATIVFLNIATSKNPVPPERGETILNVSLVGRVAPGSACIINAHRLIYFQTTAGLFRGSQFDLPHWDFKILVALTFDIDSLAVRENIRDGFGLGGC
jgi:hypothetical protein